MSTKRLFFNICLIALALSSPAHAQEPSPAFNFKGLYELKIANLPFGKVGFEAAQDAAHYDIACDIAFTGALQLFIKHSSHTTVAARGGNITYETNYRTRDKKREVKLTYAGGLLTNEELNPPENRAKRPEVPMALKQDAADPLTLILRMRQKLMSTLPLRGRGGDSQGEGTYGTSPHPTLSQGEREFNASLPEGEGTGFTINVYDGRRLTEVYFTPQGKHMLGKTPVIAVAVRRKLLGGFTQSELANYDPNEPTLYIYFSDDARLIPIRFEVTPFWGTLSATLVKECGKGESCLLGIKE